METNIMINNNAILDRVIHDRKGHYCHDIEVNSPDEIECIVEGLMDSFRLYEYGEQDYINFFNSITIHYLGEDETEEEECYSFNFNEFIEGSL